jgi:hypothetical protein
MSLKLLAAVRSKLEQAIDWTKSKPRVSEPIPLH